LTKNPNHLSAISVAGKERGSLLGTRIPQVPKFNKKIEKGLKNLFTEHQSGFGALLRYDNNKFIDRLMFESQEGWSSGSSCISACSSGSCSFLQPRNLDDSLTKYNSELKDQLKNCLLTQKPDITFDDIAGNEYVKDLIRETVLLPALVPSLFSKSRGRPRSWNKILLYGPPGVGKTMIAQAICNEIDSTCFWVSYSDITSKFIGESEKLLTMLFQMAGESSPSVIVFDGIDSLVRKRSGAESETERRIKTEFLTAMDVLQNERKNVMVIGTTSMPWELDVAALRRFDRKIMVSIPDKDTRSHTFELLAGQNHDLTEEDFNYLAEITDGYSGSDISIVCNEALLKPVKMLQYTSHFKKVRKDDVDYWTPCKASDPEAIERSLTSIEPSQLLLRKVNLDDFKSSINNCKPTVQPNLIELYLKFLNKYGHSEQKRMMLSEDSRHLSYFC